ncbi:hypothetical protein Hanom_Chr04g00285181 [Helianthus anomalus]
MASASCFNSFSSRLPRSTINIIATSLTLESDIPDNKFKISSLLFMFSLTL